MPGSTSVKSTQPNRYVSLDERDQREQELFEKREAKLNIIGQETSESAQTEAQLKGEMYLPLRRFPSFSSDRIRGSNFYLLRFL